MRSYITAVLLLVVLPVCCSLSSDYIKTEVLEELATCSDLYSKKVYASITCKYITDCAISCSAKETCKRFMFDPTEEICSLYDSGENCFTPPGVGRKVCYIQKAVCDEVSCPRCAIGYYGEKCQSIVKDCADKDNRLGVYDRRIKSFIQPTDDGPILEVNCRSKGKTIVQYRPTNCKEVNFNRTWEEYVNGFGNHHGEYWLGLKNIYRILNNAPELNHLQILFSYANGNSQQAVTYKHFKMAPDADYSISLESYNIVNNDTTRDLLLFGNFSIYGRPFSTYDRDNSNNNCPQRLGGGWWYLEDPVCSRTNINGLRSTDGNQESSIRWSYDQNNTQITFLSLSLSSISL